MFQVSNCPPSRGILPWMKDCMASTGRPFTPVDCGFDPALSIKGLAFDSAAVLGEIEALMAEFPPASWKSQPPNGMRCLSLSYDPDAPAFEWHNGSLGNVRYQAFTGEKYFGQVAIDYANERFWRGDYLDAYGFRKLLPQIEKYAGLSTLLSSFALPVVFARIRVIDGRFCKPSDDYAKGGFHIDCDPCEIIRVNVCVSTSDDFGLQYEGHAPFFPHAGDNYIISTNHLHRPWMRGKNPTKRVHITLDLVPWFDYDAASDTWTPNAHYNTTNPFDMVRSGAVLKGTQ